MSNPDVGTSGQKAHIQIGMGNWRDSPCTTGHTSENVGSTAVRARRQTALITEGKRPPAGSNCHQKAHVAKAKCASQAGVTSQQTAHLKEV